MPTCACALPCPFLPLQVWFCTQKGYKPWLQPDAHNTRTNEEGGQTTWYDEPQLLQARRDGSCCVRHAWPAGGAADK